MRKIAVLAIAALTLTVSACNTVRGVGQDLEAAGGYKYPASQTPWQEIQRAVTGQLGEGAVLENAVKYQRIHETFGVPRDNH